jgi:thiamine biosynthesis lipoprotein
MVNRYAGEKPVPVNPMTFEVLQQAIRFSKLSDGAFDVTVGPLVDLWRQAGEADETPTEEALAEARAKVGYDKLLLDTKAMTVQFAAVGMRIDLGGIAKGYAVDQSVHVMMKRGALGGMVDLGGNIRCFGRPPQQRDCWRVGLQDPNVAPDDLAGPAPLLVLAITDESVATSGHYRRFVKVHGERQSHILDAHTGRGAAQLASVTVIAPDAISADALSTAVSVLGQEKGLALIETLPNIKAILIPAAPNAPPIFTTRGGSYIR